MAKYSERLSDSHPDSGLVKRLMSTEPYIVPLFDQRHGVVWPPASLAAQFVMRRCRVAPQTAEVIAVLAGLGSEVRS
jgi:hypothetical protein